MKCSVVLVAFLLLGESPSAVAALDWKAKELILQAESGQARVEARFEFDVSGSSGTTIESIEAGCDCVIAKTEQRSYRPGETGTIQLTAAATQRDGEQTKSIIVKGSADGKVFVNVLKLTIRIPEVLRFSRRVLVWKASDVSPQQVEIERVQPVEFSSIKATEGFAVDVPNPQDPKKVILRISPAPPPRTMGSVELTGALKGGVEQHWRILLKAIGTGEAGAKAP